jgi:hypothetical protein
MHVFRRLSLDPGRMAERHPGQSGASRAMHVTLGTPSDVPEPTNIIRARVIQTGYPLPPPYIPSPVEAGGQG